MAALAVVMIGAGVFLLYEAYKSSTPTPITTATTALTPTKAA
jgi:hypothetical protein